MADFNSLATSYVLADSDDQKRELAAAAATAIQNAPRKSAAVLIWAQSINQWMPSRGAADDIAEVEEGGEAASDGDAIIRAKALSFLADTLEALSDDVLKAEQVEHLVRFFGAMFAIDHKAGVLAAAKALRHLSNMKAFKPHMGDVILKQLVQLKDDFRLQAPATRLEIYQLIERLLADDSVRLDLQNHYGTSSNFMLDLLRLCRHERDPNNLIEWFEILSLFLNNYTVSTEAAEEVFAAFSDYFPISMRSSAAPTAVTVDDLKTALRMCFAASGIVAGSAFDFLIRKLDQGDAITATVKVDVLRTIHACVENFSPASQRLAPYTTRIWNSLKYEVRNGEAQEAIDGTLRVIGSISKRLSSAQREQPEVVYLGDFVKLALADCLGDLANPTYAKRAGQLLTSVMRGSTSAFGLALTRVLDAAVQGLRPAKSLLYTRDLVSFLNDLLRVRSGLAGDPGSEMAGPVADEFHNHDAAIRDMLDSIYLRVWSENLVEQPGPDQVSVLEEVVKGLAELVRQQGPSRGHERTRLCTPEQCLSVFRTLTPCLIVHFSAHAAAAPAIVRDLAQQAMLSLQSAIASYPEGFTYLIREVAASVEGTSSGPANTDESLLDVTMWTDPSPRDLVMLKDMLSRLAFIGCSTVPSKSHPLSNFIALTGCLLGVLELLLDRRVSFRASTVVLSGIYGAMLRFRDACFEDLRTKPTGPVDPLPTTWGKNFRQTYDFPAIDVRSKDYSPKEWGPRGDSFSDLKPQQIFREYLEASLCIVSQLYRRATTDAHSPTAAAGQTLSEDFFVGDARRGDDGRQADAIDSQDAYLHQLASMASFVVQDLDETEQMNMELHKEPFALFQPRFAGTAMFRSLQASRLDVLSMGVVKGLWPATLAKMTDVGFAPISLLDDYTEIDSLQDRTRYVRNCTATIVCNKFSTNPNHAAAWGTIMDAVRSRISKVQDHSLSPKQFSRLVAITAGAVARLDKQAREVAAALPDALSNTPTGVEEMARSLDTMTSPKDYLTSDSHAVVKPIYRQWLYAQLVKPLMPLAFPFKPVDPSSTIYTISILAIMRHMPAAVYEDDLDMLARMLIATITGLPDHRDIEVALRMLIEVVDNKPQALQGHLKELTDGTLKLFVDGSSHVPRGVEAGQQRRGAASIGSGRGGAAVCRKQAVLLLSQLPSKYEERYLLPHSRAVSRVLATACGDRVREIREIAQKARENWSNVR